MDGFDHPLKIAISLQVNDRDLVVDYAGSSPQVNRGINVVYNYTHAYTTYPLACSISPAVPNNEGSFRPVRVKAPEGCILNAQFPCAVGARQLIGHFLSQAVFGALSRAIPDRVLADGSAGLWHTQLEGHDRDGRMFAYIFFSAGGLGARVDGGHAAADGVEHLDLDGRRLGEHCVAGEVTDAIVHRLEIVNVENDQCELPLVSPCPRSLALKCFVKEPIVV